MKIVFLVTLACLISLALVRPTAGQGGQGGKPGDKDGKPGDHGGKPGDMGGPEPGKRYDGKPREHGKGPGPMPHEKGPRWDKEFGKPEDKPSDFKYGDTFLRVLGKSGAIALSKFECKPVQLQNETGDGQDGGGEKCKQRKSIIIRMERMEEKDMSGQPVGIGSGGHVFKNFARQEFSFDVDDEGAVPNSNVTAKIVTFSAYLAGVNANLTIDTYIIKEDGYIMNDNETQDVQTGDVKFSITVNGWDFVENEGKYLDLTLKIQSPGKPSRKHLSGPEQKRQHRGGKVYAMDDSGSAVMVLSEKVQVDGVWKDMQDGFPQMEEHGVNSIFKFRFPKFSGRVFYDPSLSLSLELDEDDHAAATRAHLSLALVMSVLMAVWALS